MTDDARPTPAVEVPVCYRHPDRETYVRCTRCERPICPDDMIPASVGFQCPECVRAGAAQGRVARTVVGGRLSNDPGYVTKVLIGLNVVLFLLQQVSDSVSARLWLVGLVRDPQLGGAVVGVGAGEWYRLATTAFLHGSVLHLLFNMYALWLFGPALEQALGRTRFVTLYLISALGGSAASYAFSAPNRPSLGASGAIFGLFAAYLILSRKLGRDVSGLLVVLALNVVLGFTVANIDWRAHAGGFVTGAVLGALLVHAPRERRTLTHVVGAGLLVLVLLGWVTVRTGALLDVPTGTVLSCEATAPVDPHQSFLDCASQAQGPMSG